MKRNLLKLVRLENPTVRFLLAANALTIIFAVLFNWSLSTILWGYWLQSVIIGFFIFLKLLVSAFRSKENMLGMGFFANAIFLLFAFGINIFIYGSMIYDIGESFRLIDAVDIGSVLFIGLIFFINHAFSFWFNVIKNKEGFGRQDTLPVSKRFIAKLKEMGKKTEEVKALLEKNARKRAAALATVDMLREISLRLLPFEIFTIAVTLIVLLTVIPTAILFQEHGLIDLAILKLELVVFLAGKAIVDVISHNAQHNKNK